MNEFQTLDKININEECIVIDILFDNKFSQRMNDIGIIENSKIKVLFKNPQRAITPGQYVVLYDEKGLCLGGGVIDNSFKN